MNIQQTVLAFALSTLIVALPACCWKNRSCCSKGSTHIEHVEESNNSSNDKAVTKF